MTELIISADDFGYSEEVDKSIIELVKYNKISSTSILANYVTTESLKLLVDHFNAKAGMHFNIVEGKPLSEKYKVRSLINSSGHFYPLYIQIPRVILGLSKKNEIKEEFHAQMNFLKSHGIKISHIDSHQHMHGIIGFRGLFISILKENNIDRTRAIRLVRLDKVRYAVLALLTLNNKRIFRKNDLKTPDYILTSLSVGRIKDIHKYMNKKKGRIELIAHPSFKNFDDYLDRQKEFDFLMSSTLLESYKKGCFLSL